MPEPVTTVEQVVRRGGVTVVGLVAVVGVLLQACAAGAGSPTAGSTSSPPVAAPASPLPGWQVVEPVPPLPHGQPCNILRAPHIGAKRGLGLPPQDLVENTFVSEITRQARLPAYQVALVTQDWQPYSAITGTPRGYLRVTLPGPAYRDIVLDVVSYSSTPARGAESDVGTYGNCMSVSRRVLDDGTVLQLYRLDGKMSVHCIHVYQPNGRLYVMTATGIDPAVVRSSAPAGGSDPLPQDDSRLAEVAESLARLGR